MSSEASSGEQISTTTVSSVAVQAGNSRIVIGILKVRQHLLTLMLLALQFCAASSS